MAKVISLQDWREHPLSHRAAEKQIRAVWVSGTTTWLQQPELRLNEREIEMCDLEYLIFEGTVVDHCRDGDLWRYEMRGSGVDKQPMACWIVLKEDCIIITQVV